MHLKMLGFIALSRSLRRKNFPSGYASVDRRSPRALSQAKVWHLLTAFGGTLVSNGYPRPKSPFFLMKRASIVVSFLGGLKQVMEHVI